MTTIPIDRTGDDDRAAVELSTTRARVRARGGALAPVDDLPTVRFDRTAVLDLVRPPDVWSEPRPSLRDLWFYAVYGKWTGEGTPSRYAGALYATVVSLPVHALAYLALWLVERPARLAVTAILVLLAVIAF